MSKHPAPVVYLKGTVSPHFCVLGFCIQLLLLISLKILWDTPEYIFHSDLRGCVPMNGTVRKSESAKAVPKIWQHFSDQPAGRQPPGAAHLPGGLSLRLCPLLEVPALHPRPTHGQYRGCGRYSSMGVVA